MRFKVKQHKYNDTRIVKKFAWLPIEVYDCMVWLEYYTVEQFYLGAGIGFNWFEIKSTRKLIKK